MTNKQIREKVVAPIIAAIKESLDTGDIGKFVMPFPRILPMNTNGRYYRGINSFLLSLQSFKSPVWGTWKAWGRKGYEILDPKGYTHIVFAKPWYPTVKKKDIEGEGESEEEVQVTRNPVWVLRYSRVYNQEQTSARDKEPSEIVPALKPKADALEFSQSEKARKLEVLQERFPAPKPTLKVDTSGAFYIPSRDEVHLPPKEQFHSFEGYAYTLCHEWLAGHATGHPNRLNRKQIEDFSRESYAFEELVANFGACITLARLGIQPDLGNYAAYAQSWARYVVNHKNAEQVLMMALHSAWKASDFAFIPAFGSDENGEDDTGED